MRSSYGRQEKSVLEGRRAAGKDDPDHFFDRVGRVVEEFVCKVKGLKGDLMATVGFHEVKMDVADHRLILSPCLVVEVLPELFQKVVMLARCVGADQERPVRAQV